MIYHYTDIDALINILRFDRIIMRATNCMYLTYIIHTFGHNVSFIESDFRITSSLIWLCNFFEESIPNKTMLMVEYRLGSRTSVRYRHESSLFPKEEFGERRLIV